MRSSACALSMVLVLLSAACESPPLATEPTLPQFAQVPAGFALPPGESTLEYSIGAGYRTLILEGSPELRIRRVLTASGVDVEFAGHSPREATAFFQTNPLPGPDPVTIYVGNPTDRSIHLTVNERAFHGRP